MAVDKILICKTCGKEFVFTASEQEFFASKGFTNEPTRCKDCRAKMRQEREERQTTAVCSSCGKTEAVSFKVTHPELLLCEDCFQKLKPAPPPQADEQTPPPGELVVME